MFTTKTVFNLVDFEAATLVLGGGDIATFARVELLPSKSTAGGSTSGPAVTLTTLAVPVLDAVTCKIDSDHPALSNYGAIRVRSVDAQGNPGGAPFIAYVTLNGPATKCPVSGPQLGGHRYRIAYGPPPASSPTQTMRIVVTSIEFAQPVQIKNPKLGGFSTVLNVGGDHSWLWDSAALGINVNGKGLIEIVGQSGGPLAVMASIQSGNRHFRMFPARLA